LVNVLLLEAQPDTCAVLTNLLTHWGYDVAVAESVASAMMLLENFRFDALLSDLALCGPESLQMTVEAKRRQPRTVAVAFGQSDEGGGRECGQKAGFEHYLSKPVDAQALHALLAAA
jgi:two-component system CheB/CheR fusion protein